MNQLANWRGAVEQIRRASSARGRARTGTYTIEGTRLHERALRAGLRAPLALVGAGYRRDPAPRVQTLLAALAAQGCRLVEVPDAVMAELTGGRGLGDIVGLLPLPAPPPLPALFAAPDGQTAVVLAALNVVDPGNVGALLRTAHAAGASGFIAVGVSDPFHPRAVRTSRGSLFKLPLRRYAAVEPLLDELAGLGVVTVGTAVSGAAPLPQLRFDASRLVVFMGSEAAGLPPALHARLDQRVTIPMAPGVDSFAVNAAAAIVLYALLRRG